MNIFQLRATNTHGIEFVTSLIIFLRVLIPHLTAFNCMSQIFSLQGSLMGDSLIVKKRVGLLLVFSFIIKDIPLYSNIVFKSLFRWTKMIVVKALRKVWVVRDKAPS